MSMPENSFITLEDLKKHFERLEAETIEDSEAVSLNIDSPYIEAASVLIFFNPATIHPVGGANSVPVEQKQSLIYELISCSDTVIDTGKIKADPTRPRHESISYTLKDDVRKKVLNKLAGEHRLLKAVEANISQIEASDNKMQKLLVDWINTVPFSLATLDVEWLSALRRVADWIESSSPVKIPKEEITRRIQLSELLESFKHLTGKYEGGEFHETFRGRKEELSSLRSYVGVAPPKGTLEYLGRMVENAKPLSYNKKLPLLIFGPGGVGKSSLVAKFILEHIEAEQADRFPFVYLDFDRPSLNANHLGTLFVEAARQLSIQFSDIQAFATMANEFYERWKDHFLLMTNVVKTKKISIKSISGTEEQISATSLIETSFLDLIKKLGEVQKRPFLLVMDTFEEVQYKGPVVVGQLYEFIRRVQKEYPLLRPVVAGRAPVSKVKLETIQLRELDIEASQGYLLKQGITDPAKALSIAIKVGGNPLTLKLAADLVKNEGFENFNTISLSTTKLFFFEQRLSQQQIQGILYERILDHIRDKRVRDLAHPGLVLRYITPDLILKVLAAPCRLNITTMAEASELFQELKKEVSLVTPEARALRHRPDVRKVMLQLLNNDKPEVVKMIHQLAVEYYSKKDEIKDRAEEIYHRLALHQSTKDIDVRWVEGVQHYLMNTFDELPPEAQAYLASRTGIDNIDDALWRTAAPEDKERLLTRRVADCLNSGFPQKALDMILQNKPAITSGILTLLEIRALIHLGRKTDAEVLAKNTISTAASKGLSEQLVQQISQYTHLTQQTGGGSGGSFATGSGGSSPKNKFDIDQKNFLPGDDMTEFSL